MVIKELMGGVIFYQAYFFSFCKCFYTKEELYLLQWNKLCS